MNRRFHSTLFKLHYTLGDAGPTAFIRFLECCLSCCSSFCSGHFSPPLSQGGNIKCKLITQGMPCCVRGFELQMRGTSVASACLLPEHLRLLMWSHHPWAFPSQSHISQVKGNRANISWSILISHPNDQNNGHSVISFIKAMKWNHPF